MYSFVSNVDGAVIILTMWLVSSFHDLRVVFGFGCDWVDLRPSRARCLRRMALLRSARMSFWTVFGQNMLRVFCVTWVNGALVGKRQVAVHSLSARRSCMVLALYSMYVLVILLAVLLSNGSVWVGDVSEGRILVRSMWTRAAVNYVSPCIYSDH